jgi:glycosyltransferase involved in cell wall biosynthesis
MNNPRVSVVMPMYNTEAYVAEAIESVLAQSFTDFELLIIDDAGQDSSLAIAGGYDDPRIRIISQPNRGLAGARNTGIAAARGDYVALIDADDRWLSDKLLLHVIHLDASPHVDVSYCGSHFIDQHGRRLRQAQQPRLADITPAIILCRNPVGNGSAAVLRRTTLDTMAFAHPAEPQRRCFFDEDFRQSEDIEMWTRMAAGAGARFEGIAPLLTEYRIVGGGLSANMIRQYDYWQQMVAKLRVIAPDLVRRHGRRARAYQLRYLARRAVQMGDPALAMMFVRDALASSWRPLVEEPVKTLVTVGSVVFGRLFGPATLARVAGRWTGSAA